jgi:6-pyruvoyltetrahydropterin/6-carboxytetrahydropterin synthase
MYSIRIRDHLMIAHSLPDPFFGPASALHGATYIVDAEFFTEHLDAHHVVIDIGYAHGVLREVIGALNYSNLDVLPEFAGMLTTTEFLSRHIHGLVAGMVRENFSGVLKITLGESHIAWASYEAPVL